MAPIFGCLRWVPRNQCLNSSILKVRGRQLEQLVEAAIPQWLLNVRRGQHPRAVSSREVLPKAPKISPIELSDLLLDLVPVQNRRQRHHRGLILVGCLMLVLCFFDGLLSAHYLVLGKWRLLNSRISR